MDAPPSGPGARPFTYRTVACGSMSQAHPRFGKWANAQCAAISQLAIVRACVDRRPFDNADVNVVLLAGDAHYRKCRALFNPVTGHLEPDVELLPEVEFQGQTVTASAPQVRHGPLGLVSMDEYLNGTSQCRELDLLASSLDELCSADEHGTGYIFLTRSNAVAFWEGSDGYYLYDPHQRDCNRLYQDGGVARLFLCADVLSLAMLLHSENENPGYNWGIYRVTPEGEQGKFPLLRVPPPPPPPGSPEWGGSLSSSDDDMWYEPALGAGITDVTADLTEFLDLMSEAPGRARKRSAAPADGASTSKASRMDETLDSSGMPPPSSGSGLGCLERPARGASPGGPLDLDPCGPAAAPGPVACDTLSSPGLPPYTEFAEDASRLFQGEGHACAPAPSGSGPNSSASSQTRGRGRGRGRPPKRRPVFGSRSLAPPPTLLPDPDPPTPPPAPASSPAVHRGGATGGQAESESSDDCDDPAPRKRGRPRKVRRGGRQALTDEERAARAKEWHAKHNAKRSDAKRASMTEQYARSPERHRAARRESDAAASERSPERVRARRRAYVQANPEARAATQRRYRDATLPVAALRRRIARALPPSMRHMRELAATPLDRIGDIERFSLQEELLSECPRCTGCNRSPLFHEEKGRKEWCCRGGKLIPPRVPDVDAEFYSADEFLKKAREYNALYSFAALSCSNAVPTWYDRSAFYAVSGRVYARLPSLDDPHTRNNLTMYIHDALNQDRVDAQRLDREVLADIREYLDAVNPFLPELRRLNEHVSATARLRFQLTSRATHGNVLGDMPLTDQIAAVIELSEALDPRSVVIWKRGQSRAQFINRLDPAYEPLTYPLLFPHGTAGWHPDLVGPHGDKITHLRYVRHLLLAEPRFSGLRRLSQEWLVDSYCRVEEERLMYFKLNQGSLRSAERSDLVSVAAREQVRVDIRNDETISAEGPLQAGRIYLPSSFLQGPRFMRIKYCDCMATVVMFGNPTFMITLTCNPRWPEIQRNLRPGERATDNPMLCVRAFHIRLQRLLSMIKSGALFGEIDYYSCVIEYQKRHGVHAHIIVRVKGGLPEDPDIVDRYVQATIPPAGPDGLQDAVLEFMLHGPCGASRPTSSCMQNNRCTKKFPKARSDRTHIDDKGFAHYRRPCERTVTHRGRQVDDQWVVPYNAAILMMMQCHVNVEWAGSATCVQYIYKYLTKGPDKVLSSVTDRQDEVEGYLTRRFIGGPEATWKTLQFASVERHPPVEALVVHMEERMRIIHKRGAEGAAAADTGPSNLELYFARPAALHHLKYTEVYSMYNRATAPLKTLPSHGPVLGGYYFTQRQAPRVSRLHWVGAQAGEAFYLRLLLTHFPARSFEELRTVDGKVTTFQAACAARHLLDDSREWFEAMREAATFKSAARLRSLLVSMIICGAPGGLLWEEFAGDLSADFVRRHSADAGRNLALLDLSRRLAKHGRALQEVGIEEAPVGDTAEVIRERTRWDVAAQAAFHDEWRPRLEDEQLRVLDTLDAAVLSPADPRRGSSVFFLEGAAGTGKSVLLKTAVAGWRAHGRIAIVVASTGAAALPFEGGQTAHSVFRIPVDKDRGTLVCSVDVNDERAALLRAADAFVWDEAPMANYRDVDAVNRLLKDLTGNAEHFGGKVFIFSGDFRQIPPVIPGAGVGDLARANMRNLPFWRDVTVLSLTVCRRAQDPEFAEFLLSVGEGRAEATVLAGEQTPVIALPGIASCASMEELVDFVYPESVLADPDQCADRAILSGTNSNIRAINGAILVRLVGVTMTQRSVDRVRADSCGFDPNIEFLNTLTAPGVPDNVIDLKVGCVVMLLKNLSFDDGLVNGAKFIVTRISAILIELRKPNTDELYYVSRVPFTFTVGRNGFEVVRVQFPLKLAYAATFNKSQGQTLSRAGVDLRTDVFSHGQLYVALGRVRTRESLMVLVADHRIDAEDGTAYAYNLVHAALL